MDWSLPESAYTLRATARQLVEEVLRPSERSVPPAEGELPVAVRQRCVAERRARGLWGLSVPRAEGGAGLSWLEQAVVHEALHRSPLGFWPHRLFTAGEVPAPLYQTQGLQREYLFAPVLRGERHGYQLVVPAAVNPAGQGLHVRPLRDGAVLNGYWPDVPAVAAADLLVVVVEANRESEAQGGDDASRGWGLLCELGMTGFSMLRPRATMGAACLCDLCWENCVVGPERILQGVGESARRWQALRHAAVMAAGAVGAAEYALEMARDHARTRQTFGRPLGDRQAVQWMLADSARELHAARLLVYRAASAADAGEDPGGPAAEAKAYATEVACRILDRTIQIHGGYGYSRDLPLERLWRELCFYQLVEGSRRDLLAARAEQMVAALNR